MSLFLALWSDMDVYRQACEHLLFRLQYMQLCQRRITSSAALATALRLVSK